MKLTRSELQSMRLQAKKNFVLKLLIYFLGLTLPVIFAMTYEYQWWVPLAMAVILSHGTQLMHQLTHGVYKPLTDRIIGGALGFMLLENFSEYRTSHLYHHRYIGTEQYHCHPSNQIQSNSWVKVLYGFAHLFKLVFYFRTLKRLLNALNGKSDIAENDRQRRWICTDYHWMLLGYVAVVTVVAIFGQWTLLFDFWLLPVIIASVLHTLIELTTHAGCQMDDPNPELNARSIETNAFMRWYSNFGCYHAEHHKYMWIPLDALTDLKSHMHMQLHYRCNGYFDLCLALIKRR